MIKNALKNWPDIKNTFKGKRIALFLDYDGTLAPIANTPPEAVLPAHNKILLEKLAHLPWIKVVIITGRSLNDIKTIAGIRNIVYVGNHGFEIDGKGFSFKSLRTPYIKNILDELNHEFNPKQSGIQGVILEDKELTLSVHYRLVETKKIPKIRNIFKRICRPYLLSKKIVVSEGKKVLEIRPPMAWDKGYAVLWLWAQEKERTPDLFPIYIGDDATDETAFAALKGKGLTITVGPSTKKSSAQYYLNGPNEVSIFLQKILDIVSLKELSNGKRKLQLRRHR